MDRADAAPKHPLLLGQNPLVKRSAVSYLHPLLSLMSKFSGLKECISNMAFTYSGHSFQARRFLGDFCFASCQYILLRETGIASISETLLLDNKCGPVKVMGFIYLSYEWLRITDTAAFTK